MTPSFLFGLNRFDHKHLVGELLLVLVSLFTIQSESLSWIQPFPSNPGSCGTANGMTSFHGSMPCSGNGLTAGFWNESVWLIGGLSYTWENYFRVWEYNIYTKNYTIHPSIAGSICVVAQSWTQIDHKLYIAASNVYLTTSSIGAFDMNSKEYDSKAVAFHSNIIASCLANIDTDFLLLLGGIYNDDHMHGKFHIFDLLTKKWLFAKSTYPWTAVSMLTPVWGHTCIVHQNILYVIGGNSKVTANDHSSGQCSSVVDIVQVIDVHDITNVLHSKWSVLTDTLSVARCYLRSVAYGNWIFAIGGQADGYHYRAEVDIIDTSTMSITLDSVLVNKASRAAAVIGADDLLYVFGGIYTHVTKDWLGQENYVKNLDAVQLAPLGPTQSPTPSDAPTITSDGPSNAPTIPPSAAPTIPPTTAPTDIPSSAPTISPSDSPTMPPTSVPTIAPTIAPSGAPTMPPTTAPTIAPSISPSIAPTTPPTVAPTMAPTTPPSVAPSSHPTTPPTNAPSSSPTYAPSAAPTRYPTTESQYGPLLYITYTFDNLTTNNSNDIMHDGTVMNDIILILDRSYLEHSKLYANMKEDELQYRSFEIVTNLGTMTRDTKEAQVIIPSFIKCTGKDVVNTMTFITSKSIFIGNTTTMFRSFFSNNAVTFSATIMNGESKGSISKLLYNFIYGLLSFVALIILLSIATLIYCRKNYMNAFVLENVLVLIIGVSKYDDSDSDLPDLVGVKQNVSDLEDLWRDKYKYDVFVCNANTLYSSKADVVHFIQDGMLKLEDKNNNYGCVIVHIIAHGSDDFFNTSDGKDVSLDFIRHELVTVADFTENLSLIKLIFHHCCQGMNDYRTPNVVALSKPSTRAMNMHYTLNNNNTDNVQNKMSYDSNCMTISGNLSGRAMSDDGHFTECICDAFAVNLNRRIKADFNSLITEIGRNLEHKTHHSEICNVTGALRYNPMRFEKSKGGKKDEETQPYQMSDGLRDTLMTIADDNSGNDSNGEQTMGSALELHKVISPLNEDENGIEMAQMGYVMMKM
eukprot:124788_1